MRVSVIGLGYVGLPTAAMLAARGHEVFGCDVNPEVVAAVNAATPHFAEPDLDMLLEAAVTTGRLSAATTPREAEAHLLAVPTPLAPDRRADLSFLEAAVESLLPLLKPGDLVVVESTVPVGTTERLAARIGAARPDLALPRRGLPSPRGALRIAHCPERVLPGAMLRELASNDRIVGGISEDCAEAAAALYEGFVSGGIHRTDARTAEFAKLAENAYRDVNIAFANELSAIAERAGVDVWRAIALANRHPRVDILRPGPGVGGHCIAVDPWFLAEAAPEEAPLIRTARAVNDGKPARVAARVLALSARFRTPRIACYGLSYKPDVDDLRESPALEVVERVARAGGAEVLVVEPYLQALPARLAALPGLRLAEEAEAREAADIVVFLVAHRMFRRLPAGLFAEKAVVDAAGVLVG
ncbi:MAG: UDP-N-acetyl-D-mannosamine dehydrogenase [Acetobacteraceae bacterium]|nr:UDP-N-acetyl-D-mannosamine dehydrogenase [Acetobacteraceae bacterium]